MLKFIWGRGQGPTAERVKLQKELFHFSKNITYGFPNKPSCIDWDPELRLLVVGTKGGALRVFGAPGVELLGQHAGEEVGVLRVLFVPGQARLICLTSDNSLHLWQLDGSQLARKQSVQLEGRLKTVSSLCLEQGRKRLLVGTEGGNIYQLQLWNFQWDEEIIYQDLLMRTVPDNYKLNPGAVESILERPGEPNQLIIGYTRGLVLLWDRAASCSVTTFISQQQLESVVWRAENRIVSAHNDGSFVIWDTETGEQVEPPNTPYGPYPCKAIPAIYSRELRGVGWQVFSGGMPRASYGDKFTVTVMRQEEGEEEQHTVFDLTSKIVDFLVLEGGEGGPDYLLILSEEELVCVDLASPSWPTLEAPYMQSIHSSAITTITQVNDVNNQISASLESLGGRGGEVEGRGWPVTGGEEGEGGGPSTLIVTGHEDGSVKFWMSRDNLLSHLTTLATGKFFRGEDDFDDDLPREDDEEDEWPPFRKVGSFDPYSDDPRLAVKKLLFCGETGILVVGGTAGQVLVCSVAEARDFSPTSCKAETVTEKEGFTWKGHKPLELRAGPIQQEAGFQPSLVLQITPPASVTSLSMARQWGVLAVGTAHGVVVLDYSFQHVVTARSTLSSADIANADDNPMSRKKSLKKSLRESFRRLRKGRSQVPVKGKEGEAGIAIKVDSPRDRAPVERAVEARGQRAEEDGLGSMVRCLHFSSTYIANSMGVSPTLWAGTNTGQVLVFLLTITPVDKRKNDKITAVLAKEIQLKHKAPVIDIEVHDAGGLPVSGGQPSYPAPHRVLITSEEQFKLFLLPQLKPCGKYKLTAHEGIRVRRVRSATFTSSREAEYRENCLVYLANSGEIGVLSLPELRRQVSSAAVRKEDVVGISSLSFSNTGNGIYLSSSSELQQISLSARNTVAAGGGRVTVERREEGGQADTDSQADRQNRQNEREAGRGGVRNSPRENGDSPDPHNETAMSEVSGDITLDSIRDHMSATLRSEGGEGVAATGTEVTVTSTDLGGGRRETVETVSRTVETITVSTSQQLVQGNALAPSSITTEEEGDTTLTA